MLAQLRFSFLLLFLAWICASPEGAQKPALDSVKTTTFRVSEGTTLGFDLSPDGRSIVFDLLGQLWLIPAPGGAARPITDAVRDIAEDLDPSFSPDGRRVVFRGERNGRTGLWLLDLDSGVPRQLTQLPDPTGYEGNAAWSPDGRVIAFARACPGLRRQTPGAATSCCSMLPPEDCASFRSRVSRTPSVATRVWVRGGKQIAFVARNARRRTGRPGLDRRCCWWPGESRHRRLRAGARSHAFTATAGAWLISLPTRPAGCRCGCRRSPAQRLLTGPPIRVTNHTDVTPTRIRWVRDGSAVLYSADGRLWKVAASGGQPTEIRFTAELSLTVRGARSRLPGFLNPVTRSLREVSWDWPSRRTDVGLECSRSASCGSFRSAEVHARLRTFRSKRLHSRGRRMAPRSPGPPGSRTRRICSRPI